jgi:phage terminase large subunit-like protein
VPESTVDQQERISFRDWEQRGFIKITPGEVTDFDQVKNDILELHAKYRIRQLVYEKNNAGHFVRDIERSLPCWPFPTAHFTAAIEDVERMILARTLVHPGNQVMNFQIGNCRILQTGEGQKKPLRKNTDSILRVDGPVGLLLATAGDLEAGEQPAGVGIRWL